MRVSTPFRRPVSLDTVADGALLGLCEVTLFVFSSWAVGPNAGNDLSGYFGHQWRF